jgi:hypothetical protein
MPLQVSAITGADGDDADTGTWAPRSKPPPNATTTINTIPSTSRLPRSNT